MKLLYGLTEEQMLEVQKDCEKQEHRDIINNCMDFLCGDEYEYHLSDNDYDIIIKRYKNEVDEDFNFGCEIIDTYQSIVEDYIHTPGHNIKLKEIEKVRGAN